MLRNWVIGGRITYWGGTQMEKIHGTSHTSKRVLDLICAKGIVKTPNNLQNQNNSLENVVFGILQRLQKVVFGILQRLQKVVFEILKICFINNVKN